MPIPASGFCSDEDVALRAGPDLARVAPLDQALAAGNDGAFAPGARWTLTSASVPDFAAQGVAAGMVVLATLPRRGEAPDRQAFVADAVAGGSLTLRRKGLGSGVGQPPAPAAGASAVQFTAFTLGPQIVRASYELDQRLGIDDAVSGMRSTDLDDADQLREACALTVLWKLYQAAACEGSPDAKDGTSPDAALWAKARATRSELDETLARLDLKFREINAANAARVRSVSRFGTRLSR